MSDKFIGEDIIAESLQHLRDAFNDPPDWPELESTVYDTLKDHEALPELALSLDIPGVERLTDEEKKALGVALAERFADYGRACRKDLIVELVKARVDLRRRRG